MEGQEQMEISLRIKGIPVQVQPKQTKSMNMTAHASISTRKIESTQEDTKKEAMACEQEQTDMSSQVYIQLSASLRKVTDCVKSIATDSKTQLQEKNELLRKIDSLKHEILAFSKMSEETRRSCRHVIQSSCTATKQRQQRQPGNTN